MPVQEHLHNGAARSRTVRLSITEARSCQRKKIRQSKASPIRPGYQARLDPTSKLICSKHLACQLHAQSNIHICLCSMLSLGHAAFLTYQRQKHQQLSIKLIQSNQMTCQIHAQSSIPPCFCNLSSFCHACFPDITETTHDHQDLPVSWYAAAGTAEQDPLELIKHLRQKLVANLPVTAQQSGHEKGCLSVQLAGANSYGPLAPKEAPSKQCTSEDSLVLQVRTWLHIA